MCLSQNRAGRVGSGPRAVVSMGPGSEGLSELFFDAVPDCSGQELYFYVKSMWRKASTDLSRSMFSCGN